MSARLWLLGCLAALAFACGGNSGDGTDANGSGDGDGGGSGTDDGGMSTIDSPPFGGSCEPTSTIECSDCMDNDSDGKIDGFDPECSGAADDREDSFATGIPGDNIDATNQDCFFDGNSGAGNDGCNQDVCCILQADADPTNGLTAQQVCQMLAPGRNGSPYDKNACYEPFGNTPVPQQCIDVCGALTPPGCDCFGCCTTCNENGCRDIVLNPAVSPNCDQTNITDPGVDGIDNNGDEPCKRCVKSDCGSTECAYDGVSCTPCPGQCDQNGVCNPPLPSSCGGNTTCPGDIVPCDANGNCAEAGTFCSSGCCVGTIF